MTFFYCFYIKISQVGTRQVGFFFFCFYHKLQTRHTTVMASKIQQLVSLLTFLYDLGSILCICYHEETSIWWYLQIYIYFHIHVTVNIIIIVICIIHVINNNGWNLKLTKTVKNLSTFCIYMYMYLHV